MIREVRERAELSLRELAERADTSHSAISAYETGRRTPTTTTLDRIARAAGFALDATLHRRIYGRNDDRGAELEAVLALAEEFPAGHSPDPPGPVFGRRPVATGR